MTHLQTIFTSTLSSVKCGVLSVKWLRLALILIAYHFSLITSPAQGFLKLERDTIPFFRGFAVSADLVGLAQMQLGDYGQYEGALRLNLHDQYFPVVELGIGRANQQNDEVTEITYKTSAPYFRIGFDVNIMKNKHAPNRIYAGVRYGYTSYKVNISRTPFKDPVWQWPTTYDVVDEPCSQHWAEILFGIDAEIIGPLHLGWTARYRNRLSYDNGRIGTTWYVPGYGIQDTSSLGLTFNVIIDI